MPKTTPIFSLIFFICLITFSAAVPNVWGISLPPMEEEPEVLVPELPLTPMEAATRLRFAELGVEAVAVDVQKHFMWPLEDKAETRAAFGLYTAELTALKENLAALYFPGEMAGLQGMFIGIIDHVITIYGGFDVRVLRHAASSKSRNVALDAQAARVLVEPSHPNVRSFPSATQRSHLMHQHQVYCEAAGAQFHSAADRDTYLAALDLADEGSYQEAIFKLESLPVVRVPREHATSPLMHEAARGDSYEGTPGGDVIGIRIADCINRFDEKRGLSPGISDNGTVPFFQNSIFNPDLALEILDGIVNSGRYSPILAEAFFKWRTLYQEFNHGVSRHAASSKSRNVAPDASAAGERLVIPNDFYNERRRALVGVIREQLAENPGDAAARTQLGELLEIPNIHRPDSH